MSTFLNLFSCLSECVKFQPSKNNNCDIETKNLIIVSSSPSQAKMPTHAKQNENVVLADSANDTIEVDIIHANMLKPLTNSALAIRAPDCSLNTKDSIPLGLIGEQKDSGVVLNNENLKDLQTFIEPGETITDSLILTPKSKNIIEKELIPKTVFSTWNPSELVMYRDINNLLEPLEGVIFTAELVGYYLNYIEQETPEKPPYLDPFYPYILISLSKRKPIPEFQLIRDLVMDCVNYMYAKNIELKTSPPLRLDGEGLTVEQNIQIIQYVLKTLAKRDIEIFQEFKVGLLMDSDAAVTDEITVTDEIKQ